MGDSKERSLDKAVAIGAKAIKHLYGDDLSYRAFQNAAVDMLQQVSKSVLRVALFTFDPRAQALKEEAFAGSSEGQGTEEIPLYQLPKSLVEEGCTIQRQSGSNIDILSPVCLGSDLLGMILLTVDEPTDSETIDRHMMTAGGIAQGLAPGLAYVARARNDRRALLMLRAATSMSRELVGLSSATADHLLYHFVVLVVEKLGFDRATLVIFDLEKSNSSDFVAERAICATLGHEPKEIDPAMITSLPTQMDSHSELEEAPGLWVPIQRGERLLGALLADNLYSMEPPPGDAMGVLLDLTGQVALTLENASLMDQLREQALKDDLTGLYRPGYFYQRLKEEVIRLEREKGSAALLFIDLDNFKGVNDSYGHPFGDTALIQVSNFLKSEMRASDIVCRMGGDEFLVLLPHISRDDAKKLAIRLCRRFHKSTFTVSDEERPVRLSISIGLATYPEDAEDWQELIHRADEALYLAKRRGKGQVGVA